MENMYRLKVLLKSRDFEYENLGVRIVGLKEHSAVDVAGFLIGPLDKGVEVEVPRWVADMLIQMGLAREKVDDSLKLVDLTKISWREERSELLQPLDAYFYPRLRRFLRRLQAFSLREPTPIILQEQQKAFSFARDIVNCRVRKMVQAALTEFPPKSVVECMSLEERELFKGLHTLINEWRSQVLGVGVGGKVEG